MRLMMLAWAKAAYQQTRFVVACAELSARMCYALPWVLWQQAHRAEDGQEQKEWRDVNKVGQDQQFSIDVQFDAIGFFRKDAVSYARTAVEITLVDASPGAEDTLITLRFAFPADPTTDSVLAVVEEARRQAIKRLTSITDSLAARSAEDFLYGGERCEIGVSSDLADGRGPGTGREAAAERT